MRIQQVLVFNRFFDKEREAIKQGGLSWFLIVFLLMFERFRHKFIKTEE